MPSFLHLHQFTEGLFYPVRKRFQVLAGISVFIHHLFKLCGFLQQDSILFVKNKQLFIQADRRVDYGIVAEVMAEAKAAGISQLGLVTMPKDQ